MSAAASDLGVSGGWEVARPAIQRRAAGTEVVGFRDRDAMGLEMRVVPVPAVTLVIDFSEQRLRVRDAHGDRPMGALLAGLTSGAANVSGRQVDCVEVHLSPLRAYPLLGVAPADLDGFIIDLEDLWGGSVASVRDQLANTPGWTERFAIVEAFLEGRVASKRQIDPEVAACWQQIVACRGRIRIDDLARSCGWSRTRLWARFSSQIGLSPKRAAMLVRFDGAVRALSAGSPIAEVAAGYGYADQSHLHRDVATFTGCTPGALAQELEALPSGLE